MKKLGQILTAVVLSVAFVGVTANAATCDGNFTITGTGQNSNNTIECEDIDNIVATCENNVVLLTFNVQGSQTGTATVTGNTSGGSAVSGTITNSNGSTVDLSTVCAAVASPSPSPSPSVTPGGGNVTPPTVKPAALPFTSGNDALSIVVTSLAMAAIVVAASRLAVAAYRRISIK